jgi:adenylate cyclase
MYGLSIHLNSLGRNEEAIALIKKAFRLDPIPPAMYIRTLAGCYFMAERYEEAIVEYKRALERKDEFNPTWLHAGLAASYAMLGQEEEARIHVAEVLKLDPKYTVKGVAMRMSNFFRSQEDVDHVINASRKAGFPE